MQARLGPLVVDERQGFVARGEERLSLNQKAVELLIRLGRAHGRPIRRELLRCELWPDREVSDKALSMLVVELRRRLQPYFEGQDPIETVAGVGYSLSVPYESCASQLLLASRVSKGRGRIAIYVAATSCLSRGSVAVELSACFRETLINTLSSDAALEVRVQQPPCEGAPDEVTFVIQSSLRVIRRDAVLSVRCVTHRDEKICWVASRRTPTSHAFAVETELSERLRSELHLVATGSGGRQGWKHYRQSSGFKALTDGQGLVAARNTMGFSAAREKFKHALALDPGCAPALVGMADCEILSAFYDGAEASGAARRATSYVEHALSLHTDLAAAHCTRGFISLAQLQFEHAEEELREAIRLDDSNAIAFQWYADFLASQGRVVDAVQFGRLALARAPDSVVVNTQLGQLLHMAGMFDDAHTQLERVLAMDPACAGAHCFMALNLAMQGKAAALDHSERAIVLSPNTPFFRGAHGSILARLDERERALQQLHALEAAASGSAAFAEAAMMVAATLRRVKRAIDWFRIATAHSTAWALYAAALPILAPIREDAAFLALLRARGMASDVH